MDSRKRALTSSGKTVRQTKFGSDLNYISIQIFLYDLHENLSKRICGNKLYLFLKQPTEILEQRNTTSQELDSIAKESDTGFSATNRMCTSINNPKIIYMPRRNITNRDILRKYKKNCKFCSHI